MSAPFAFSMPSEIPLRFLLISQERTVANYSLSRTLELSVELFVLWMGCMGSIMSNIVSFDDAYHVAAFRLFFQSCTNLLPNSEIPGIKALYCYSVSFYKLTVKLFLARGIVDLADIVLVAICSQKRQQIVSELSNHILFTTQVFEVPRPVF